jgi:hypothetical protein
MELGILKLAAVLIVGKYKYMYYEIVLICGWLVSYLPNEHVHKKTYEQRIKKKTL